MLCAQSIDHTKAEDWVGRIKTCRRKKYYLRRDARTLLEVYSGAENKSRADAFPGYGWHTYIFPTEAAGTYLSMYRYTYATFLSSKGGSADI